MVTWCLILGVKCLPWQVLHMTNNRGKPKKIKSKPKREILVALFILTRWTRIAQFHFNGTISPSRCYRKEHVFHKMQSLRVCYIFYSKTVAFIDGSRMTQNVHSSTLIDHLTQDTAIRGGFRSSLLVKKLKKTWLKEKNVTTLAASQKRFSDPLLVVCASFRKSVHFFK